MLTSLVTHLNLGYGLPVLLLDQNGQSLDHAVKFYSNQFSYTYPFKIVNVSSLDFQFCQLNCVIDISQNLITMLLTCQGET